MYEFCGFPGSRPRAFEVTIDWENRVSIVITCRIVDRQELVFHRYGSLVCALNEPHARAVSNSFSHFFFLFFLSLSLSPSALFFVLRLERVFATRKKCPMSNRWTGGPERFDRQVARLDLLAPLARSLHQTNSITQ